MFISSIRKFFFFLLEKNVYIVEFRMIFFNYYRVILGMLYIDIIVVYLYKFCY